MAEYLLLYDADCSMCTRFKEIIETVKVHNSLAFMSIDRAEQAGILDALPDTVRHRSFHIVLPDKRVVSGSEALLTLFGLFPPGRLVSKMITSIPFGRRMLGFLYSAVARRHEAGLCKLPSAGTNVTNELDDPRKMSKARSLRLSRMIGSELSIY